MIAESTATTLTVDADLALLKPIRNHVKKVARSFGADAGTIDDFELVVSELSTNVIEHTAAPHITVSFQCENDQWILEISGADDLGEPGALYASRPPHHKPDGRGLFITNALMDSVELVVLDEGSYIRCIKTVS